MRGTRRIPRVNKPSRETLQNWANNSAAYTYIYIHACVYVYKTNARREKKRERKIRGGGESHRRAMALRIIEKRRKRGTFFFRARARREAATVWLPRGREGGRWRERGRHIWVICIQPDHPYQNSNLLSSEKPRGLCAGALLSFPFSLLSSSLLSRF